MADMPFFISVTSSSGGGTGTSNYNDLLNKPVSNISGNPVIVCELSSGVYNIDGTWVMTKDDIPKETPKDDLFYVSNDNDICKLTWITAGGIHTYSVKSDGTSADIVEDSIATTGEVLNSLVGSF